MNLRSGETTKPDNLLKKDKHRANVESTMTNKEEMQKMFADLKDTLSKEIKEFRDDFRTFEQHTKKDIKTIMDQTADLRKDLEETEKRECKMSLRCHSGGNNFKIVYCCM